MLNWDNFYCFYFIHHSDRLIIHWQGNKLPSLDIYILSKKCIHKTLLMKRKLRSLQSLIPIQQIFGDFQSRTFGVLQCSLKSYFQAILAVKIICLWGRPIAITYPKSNSLNRNCQKFALYCKVFFIYYRQLSYSRKRPGLRRLLSFPRMPSAEKPGLAGWTDRSISSLAQMLTGLHMDWSWKAALLLAKKTVGLACLVWPTLRGADHGWVARGRRSMLVCVCVRSSDEACTEHVGPPPRFCCLASMARIFSFSNSCWNPHAGPQSVLYMCK